MEVYYVSNQIQRLKADHQLVETMSQGESICGDYVKEKFPHRRFSKQTRKIIPPLELDLYNQPMKLAIEYNGPQHEQFNEHFHHHNLDEFREQQRRDVDKKRLTKEKGIYLIVVPSKYDTKESIYRYLNIRMNRYRDEILDKVRSGDQVTASERCFLFSYGIVRPL